MHRQLSLCSAYHQAGTCGLGKCTDNEARVMGIKNVRVCDMSLFPTQLNVNPSYTLYSMWEKVAHLMKDQHSGDSSNGAIEQHYCPGTILIILMTLFFQLLAFDV